MGPSSSVQVRPRLGVAPAWVISTPQRVVEVVAMGVIERPCGTKHAREPGSGCTACGECAANWRIFREMPFTTRDPSACAACAEVIANIEALHRR